MSNKSKLFSDAIADAKAIRETAFSSAKLAMAESFAPQIQNMLSTKLNEMEEELDENTDEEMSLEELLNQMEGTVDEAMQEPSGAAASGAAELERLIRSAAAKSPQVIAKIKQTLADAGAAAGAALRSEAMQEPSDSAAAGLDNLISMVKGAVAKTPALISKIKAELQAGAAGAGSALRSEGVLDEEAGGEDEVAELTVDELKDIIRDVMGELGGGEEDLEEPELEADNEIDLEGDDESLDEAMQEPSGAAAAGLDNLISMIKNAAAKTPGIVDRIKKELQAGGAGAGAAMRAEAIELAEAKKTITSLSKTLQEVNLLNSKLLYVNKLFKAKNLSESQKVNVVNALDRGKTVKETENIFLTLKESLVTSPSRPINEHKGAASRPAGVAQKPSQQILTEDVDFVNRMKKLAGII